MDALTTKRIAKLDSLTNCPSCGSPRGEALGGRKNRKVPFFCGAVLSVDPGQPIASLLPCPGPSNTAAELLELAIVEDMHSDRSPRSLDPHDIMVLEMLNGERGVMQGAWVHVCLEKLASLRLCSNIPYTILNTGRIALREAKAGAA